LRSRNGKQLFRYTEKNFQDLFGILDGADLYHLIHKYDEKKEKPSSEDGVKPQTDFERECLKIKKKKKK